MSDIIIVIPVYKSFEELSGNEKTSLRQLKKVLGNYPICILAANNFTIKEYEDFFDGKNIITERFENRFFKTVKDYNQLCLSKHFYEKFLSYHYMLIYQTDAYVFNDQLNVWMKEGYDYIGAPFHADNSEPFDINTWTVGNGGFSLRCVAACYEFTKRLESYNSIIQILNKWRCKKFVSKILIKLRLVNLSVIERILLNKYNEDFVFGVLSKNITRSFSVAPITKAIQFSFEAHPSLLYALNNNNLPFGCHGWERYERDFWKNFISSTNLFIRESYIGEKR